MSVSDPVPRDALLRLGAATAEALANVLESLCPGNVTRGGVSVCDEGEDPLTAITPGSVTASVSYVDGVSGANIFLLTPAGARALAGAMGVAAPESDDSALSELELSAIAEAANQFMAAAAAALGVVLGQEIQISPPDTRVIDAATPATEIFGSAARAMYSTFQIGNEPCRLIQLVPSAFVVRMMRALDELGGDGEPGAAVDRTVAAATGDTGEAVGLTEALDDIELRVWAELGRTDLALGDALGLPQGAVVELDHAADSPVDLFVNGVRFAHGHLIVTDEGEWALALDDVAVHTAPGAPHPDATTPHTPTPLTPQGATS